MITATAYAADTLHAPVEIISDLHAAIRMGFQIRVRTLPGGVGGWATPGKEFDVEPSLLRDVVDTDTGPINLAPDPLPEPAPLTVPIDGNAYMDLLLARQAAWESRRPHSRVRPLLEWFIESGDEQWVRLPEPAPKRTPQPRVYRTAASIRDEIADVDAQMQRIANSGSDDPASVNISPYARSRAAARAGRRRFAKLDRDLEHYTRLKRRRDALAWRLASAEAREARAAGAAHDEAK